MTIVSQQQENILQTDMDMIENNLYHEFQLIIENVSREINERILEQLVSTPLDSIIQRYEAQIPTLIQSVDNVRDVSEFLESVKTELYIGVNQAISEVSNKVIEEAVLTQLDKVYKKYEKQLPLIAQNTTKLSEVIQNLKVAEKEVGKNIENIVSKVSTEILDREVTKKFERLYDVYIKQLPETKKMNTELSQLVDQVNEAQINIYRNISNTYTTIYNKITEVIINRLDVLYEKYESQVHTLQKTNNELNGSFQEIQELCSDISNSVNHQVSSISELRQELKLMSKQITTNEVKLSTNEQKQQKVLYGVYVIATLAFLGLFL